MGVGAVGGAAYTIATAYPTARAGALQIYTDLRRLTKACEKALERARTFK